MRSISITNNSESTAYKIQSGGYHTGNDFEEYIRILGVGSWPLYHQMVALDIARRAYRLSFKHAWYDDAVSVSYTRDLRDRLSDNRNRISYIKTKILCQVSGHYSSHKGVTKAYALQPSIRWAFENMDRKRALRHLNGTANHSTILNGKNKRVTNITAIKKNEIKSGSLHGVPAWCPVNMNALGNVAQVVQQTIDHMDGECERPNALAVEIDSIAEKIRHNNNPKISGRTNGEILRDYLMRVMSEVNEIIDLASSENNYGYMPHQYAQSQAGRFYASGPTTLQNCTRLARYAALNGFYSFDIESCHHAIVLQMAQRAGIPCKSLLYYVKNKKDFRESLATELGVPVSSIKATLIQMIYGAGLNPYGSIARELTKEKLREASEIEKFEGLHTELQTTFEAMIKNSGGEDTGDVVNAMGLVEPFSRRRDDQRRLAAHLLQGIESQALQAALSVHKSSILPLHDGWVSLKPESNTEAEKAIKELTGFDLQVNEPELIKLSGI